MIGVVVIGHFPLNHNPARQGLESLEHYLLGWKQIGFALSCLQTTVFVSISLSIALTVRRHAAARPPDAGCLMCPVNCGSTRVVCVQVSDLGAVLHMIGGTAAVSTPCLPFCSLCAVEPTFSSDFDKSRLLISIAVGCFSPVMLAQIA